MMVKEIEKSGMPVVHMVNMVPVAKGIGSNRIVKTYGISFPMNDPEAAPEEQRRQRYELVGRALKALNTDVDGPTVFES